MKVKECKKKKYGYNVFQNATFLIKDMATEYPLLVFLIILHTIVSIIYPVFGIYLPKITIDMITIGAPINQILCTLGVFGVSMALCMGFSGLSGSGKYMMYNNMRRVYYRRLFLQSLSCDYTNVESASGQTKYQRAVSTVRNGDWSGTSKMTVAITEIIVGVSSFVIYSGIMSTLNILIVFFLIGLSAISLFQVRNAQKFEHKQQDDAAKVNKKIYYIKGTANNTQAGKDMRLYNTSSFFTSIHKILIKESAKITNNIQKRYFAAGAVNAAALLLRDGLSYGYLAYSVSTGKITIGDFTLYFGAITAFSGFVNTIVDSFNSILGANIQMNDMRAFLDTTDAPPPENPVNLSDIDDFSIEFKNVSFSYSADDAKILDNFSLKIENGEKIALVGVNGAGKTTIIKLLCGFYKPDSGEILIGGVNIERFCRDDLYKLFSAVFQDICIIPITVAENVSMQEYSKTDIERVKYCLSQVGLYDKIFEHKNNIKEIMTKEIEDGITLSGGQQQKLLMARALYKNSPILLLDEPTAALDPIAESQTYEDFHSFSKDKTSIYISHRLASTRFCDKIAFLNNGKITELGSHKELCLQNGNYAKMYEMQSHYYNCDKDTVLPAKEESSDEL